MTRSVPARSRAWERREAARVVWWRVRSGWAREEEAGEERGRAWASSALAFLVASSIALIRRPRSLFACSSCSFSAFAVGFGALSGFATYLRV